MKTTNKLVRTFITVSVLLTMVFCLAGCSKKTPREALDEAYQKTFIDDNPIESMLGLTELTTKLNENKAHSTGYSFTIQEISGKDLDRYAGYLSGLGLSVDNASDLLNRKSMSAMDITYGGTTYLTLGTQLQGSELFLTVPQLLDGSVTVDFSTIEEDLTSDSMIGQWFQSYNLTLPENFFSDLTQALTTSPADTEDLLAAWEELEAAILVEKLDKKEISLPESVTAKHVYNVTIPKQAYVTFMNASLDYCEQSAKALTDSFGTEGTNEVSAEFAEGKEEFRKLADSVGDVVVTVAVTKKGYINYMVSTITSGEDTATFTASFTGANTPLEAFKLVTDATINEKTYRFDLTQEFDTTNHEIDLTAKASEDNTVLFAFDCIGTFCDIEKDGKFTLDFDYLELKYGDDLSLSLAGDYYIDTTVCNIPAPAPSEYNLLRMSQADFTALLLEVAANLKEDPLLSNVFGLLNSELSYQ